MAREGKRVMLFGVTGAGKSTIGNVLLGHPDLGLDCLRASGFFSQGHGMGPGTTRAQKLTSEVPSVGDPRVAWEDAMRIKSPICVEDTPGVPDPTGNAITILDKAVQSMKDDPPHGIIYIIDGANPRHDAAVKLSLMVLEMCLQPVLTDQNLIVIYNKCGLSAGLTPAHQAQERQREALAAASESLNTVVNLLIPTQASHFKKKIVLPYEGNLTNVRQQALTLWAWVNTLPSTALDPEGASTFTSVSDRINSLLATQTASEETKRALILAKTIRVTTLRTQIDNVDKADTAVKVVSGVASFLGLCVCACLGPAGWGVIACSTAVAGAGGAAATGLAVAGTSELVSNSSIDDKKRELRKVEAEIAAAEADVAQFVANEVRKAREKKETMDALRAEMEADLDPVQDHRRRRLA